MTRRRPRKPQDVEEDDRFVVIWWGVGSWAVLDRDQAFLPVRFVGHRAERVARRGGARRSWRGK